MLVGCGFEHLRGDVVCTFWKAFCGDGFFFGAAGDEGGFA